MTLYALARQLYQDISIDMLQALCDDGYFREHVASTSWLASEEDHPDWLRKLRSDATTRRELSPDLVSLLRVCKDKAEDEGAEEIKQQLAWLLRDFHVRQEARKQHEGVE